MKAYLNGWSRMQVGVLTVGAALMVLGTSIAFGQTPATPPAPSRTPPAPPATDAPPPPAMRPLMLTDEEIQTIIAMADICVKARGLECASAGDLIAKKMQAALPKKP